MYITTPKRKGGITVVRLVHGFRENGKVRQKVIKTLGQSKDPQEIEQFKKMALSLRAKLKAEEAKQSSELLPERVPLRLLQGLKTVNDGIPDILGFLYESLGFSGLISGNRKDEFWNQVLKHCVFVRFLEPASKLKSVQLVRSRFQKPFSYDQVLRMMDRLSESEEGIKGQILEAVSSKTRSLDLLLFDVTTLYFENVTETDLKQFGYSKDGKFNEVQVVLALLTDGDGLPLTYEVFPGNTAETKTLVCSLDKLKDRCQFKKVRLTADRAMYSEKNLAYFEGKEGYEYVVACPLKKLPDRLKRRILDRRNYRVLDEDKSFFNFSYNNRSFFVGRSQRRAEHDRGKRERLLEKVRRMANERGEISVGKLSGQRGFSRYLEKAKGFLKIREDRIAEEERWDGIFGVCSNIKTLTGEELFSSYKRLWKIEESFRINKHTLKMRPIFHQKSRRIRAHILICFLAYALLRCAELKLKEAGLFYSPQRFMDILSGIERWAVKDIKSGGVYVIPRRMSEEGNRIYKAFGVKRCYAPRRGFSSAQGG